jgi:hypothetical protein
MQDEEGPKSPQQPNFRYRKVSWDNINSDSGAIFYFLTAEKIRNMRQKAKIFEDLKTYQIRAPYCGCLWNGDEIVKSPWYRLLYHPFLLFDTFFILFTKGGATAFAPSSRISVSSLC